MKLATLFFLLALPGALHAQQTTEIGLFGGFANYQGDLVEDPIAVSETRLSYGGFIRYHFKDNKLKLRGNFMYGYISGNDANAADKSLRERGWDFNSNIFEATAIAEYHPFGKTRFSETGIFRRQVSPYVGAGLGLAGFTPTVNVSDPADQGLHPEPNENNLSSCFPLVVGIRADLLEFFSLGFEVGWRATLTDYLDGVSQTGNPDKNDWYVLGGITLSFFLGDPHPSFNFNNK